MKDKRYIPPQYKKGDLIKGYGIIEMISYDMGVNWYLINNKWYAERELKDKK